MAAPGGRQVQRSRSSRGERAAAFNEVLAQGPTSIPDSNEMNAALGSVLPNYEANLLATRGATALNSTLARGSSVDPRPDNSFPPNISASVPSAPLLPSNASSAPRRERASAAAHQAAAAAASAQQGQPQRLANPADPSEQMQQQQQQWSVMGLLMSPLWAGVGALKWAGQAVADNAVAPVVRYASPLGWMTYMFDGLKELTPQRARDLARIFGNVIYNASAIPETPAGGRLVAANLKVVDSFAAAASSAPSRQLVIDGAAAFVRVAEALDTPEAKDAVQQVTVVVARLLDVLASRESKILLQDVANAVCRGFELANSPEATVMAAELTANVVHALEMEHEAAVQRNEPGLGEGRGPIVERRLADPTEPGGLESSYALSYQEAIVESFTRSSPLTAPPQPPAAVAAAAEEGDQDEKEEQIVDILVETAAQANDSSGGGGGGGSEDGNPEDALPRLAPEPEGRVMGLTQADLNSGSEPLALLQSRKRSASLVHAPGGSGGGGGPRPSIGLASTSPVTPEPVPVARSRSATPALGASDRGSGRNNAAANREEGGAASSSSGERKRPGDAQQVRRGAQLPKHEAERMREALSARQAAQQQQHRGIQPNLQSPEARFVAALAGTALGARLAPTPRRKHPGLGSLVVCCGLTGFLLGWTLLALYGLRHAVADVWRLGESRFGAKGIGNGGEHVLLSVPGMRNGPKMVSRLVVDEDLPDSGRERQEPEAAAAQKEL